MATMTKTCSVCGVEKHLVDFYFSTTDGTYQSKCIDCSKNRGMRSSSRPEDDGSTRTCSQCGQTKPISEYYYSKRDARFDKSCKSCILERQKGPRRDYKLRSKYGITAEEVDALVAAQGGKCLTCESMFDMIGKGNSGLKPNVDHDPNTGIVRGILCRRCNTILGMYSENIKALKIRGFEKLAEYLERFI